MERLLEKVVEFLQCAHHMNLRGLGEVTRECGKIVQELKAEGKTFEDVHAFFNKAVGQEIPLDQDPFLQRIKKLFEGTDT